VHAKCRHRRFGATYCRNGAAMAEAASARFVSFMTEAASINAFNFGG
jgi:hypothetical protein